MEPTWLYHATKEARIFYTTAEIISAGEGWVDSPERLAGQPDPAADIAKQTVNEVKRRGPRKPKPTFIAGASAPIEQ